MHAIQYANCFKQKNNRMHATFFLKRNACHLCLGHACTTWTFFVIYLFCIVLPPRVCSADCSDGDILQCWTGPNVPKTTDSWISILKLTIRGTMRRRKLNIFPVRFIIIAGNAVMLMKSTNYQNFIATHYQNQMNLERYIPTLYIYYWSLKNLIWLKMLGNVEASSITFFKTY